MIDRRTFLKLSAGALVLTAAGALTGCGDTVIDKTSGVRRSVMSPLSAQSRFRAAAIPLH